MCTGSTNGFMAESAQLGRPSLTGLIMLLKSYNKDIRKVCLVAEESFLE